MEFSFKDMMNIIKKNIIFMLIVAILASAGTYFATSLLVSPTYTSTVKLYVNAKINAKTSYEELYSHNYAQKMVATYIEVLNTNHFYSKVAEELPEWVSGVFPVFNSPSISAALAVAHMLNMLNASIKASTIERGFLNFLMLNIIPS